MNLHSTGQGVLSPWTCTKGLKRIGTNQGISTSQLGGTHIHAMHAGGRFGTSVKRLGDQVCQGQLSLPSFQGRWNSWALPRALNLGAITVGQRATMVELR